MNAAYGLILVVSLLPGHFINLGLQENCVQAGQRWRSAAEAWRVRSGLEEGPVYACFAPSSPLLRNASLQSAWRLPE